MTALKNKIDFIVLVSVSMANPNGDPLDGNRPRTDYESFGEMSDVCIKRKIRNRMQDLKNKIFVQSEDRCYDGFKNLKERAEKVIVAGDDKIRTDADAYAKKACETFLDVRSFGQVFAFKGKTKQKGEGLSVGVRGPVSIHQAVSVSPIEVRSMQITKSVNSEPASTKKENAQDSEANSASMSSDRMGQKHFVQFGLYKIKGSINVQLAEKTGFSEEDAETLKECLKSLFDNDASSARPDGSMEVYKLYWWRHNCPTGQYSSAKVHRSLTIKPKAAEGLPQSIDDYIISNRAELENALPGLELEIYDGR